ncbi:hypothetical protein P43SY_003572 [Pythium insidiosum]|uniref:Transmembrane protein n=1 Tax=Pythium insidiosum TaxID=114742 RepID=A0AAD5LBJ1_PYTIN|nr:hypothetical protein P43SY_003572 [Pythium insidiosum]
MRGASSSTQRPQGQRVRIGGVSTSSSASGFGASARRTSTLSTMSTASTDALLHSAARGGNGALGGGGSSSSIASALPRGGGGGVRETSSLLGDDYAFDAQDDAAYFELQLFAYRLIYVLQGAFFGLLGPSLSFFSTLALQTSNLHSPVSSFGPIFAAHGGAALVMSFMSELVLNVAIEMDLMKYLMMGLLACSGAWYACLPAVAGATGSLGVSVYFIAKGVWTALINISLNRCCLWIAGDKIENGRSLVTAMNFAYGFGTMLGPLVAWALSALALDLSYAYYALGAMQVVPLGILLVLPSPRPLHGRDHHQSLLGFEDPTRRVPTVPSPIVGGVFLHVKHYGGSANCNPDTYDPLNNLIILLVTIFATVLFGIQLGLGAFLFDYIGHVLGASSHPLPSESIYTWGCLLTTVFWAALWLSYVFFSKYMFHALNLFSIFHLSIVCMVSSFGILFGTETGFACFVLTLVLFAFALAPLFTLSIHCLTRVINELLIRRVSSLIVFGCGMGEVFLPVLMGFFMGNLSGQMYGSVAVSYITFILSICLVGVSGMLLMMVRKKLAELDASSTGGGGIPLASATGGGGGATAQKPKRHHHKSAYSQQRP